MIISGFAPDTYTKEGFYTVKQDNTVNITVENTDLRHIELLAGRPIPGAIVHTMNDEYHDLVEISADTLRTLLLRNEALKKDLRTIWQHQLRTPSTSQ